MDTAEAALEAEGELDQMALLEQRAHRRRDGERAAQIAKGAVDINVAHHRRIDYDGALHAASEDSPFLRDRHLHPPPLVPPP